MHLGIAILRVPHGLDFSKHLEEEDNSSAHGSCSNVANGSLDAYRSSQLGPSIYKCKINYCFCYILSV